MFDHAELKEWLQNNELTRKDKLLFILAARGQKIRTVGEIRDLGIASGLRRIRQWNVSSVLARGEPQAIRGTGGWELTASGKKRVATLIGVPFSAPTTRSAVELRACLVAIKDDNTIGFLDEAITCLEADLLRAAVVLSWVGAVSVLYRFIIANTLSQFNVEAARRDARWKPAKTVDDLALMKEHDFLNVLEVISMIGKNVKQELQGCLTLRNSCGHPNSFKLGSNRVAAHVETLVLNVFQKF